MIGAVRGDILQARLSAVHAVEQIDIVLDALDAFWVLHFAMRLEPMDRDDPRPVLVVLPSSDECRVSELEGRCIEGRLITSKRLATFATFSSEDSSWGAWELCCKVEVPRGRIQHSGNRLDRHLLLSDLAPKVVGAAINGHITPRVSLRTQSRAPIDLAFVTSTPSMLPVDATLHVEDAGFARRESVLEFEPQTGLSVVVRATPAEGRREGLLGAYVSELGVIFDFLRELYAADFGGRLAVEVLPDDAPAARLSGPVIEVGDWISQPTVENRAFNTVAMTAQLNQLWLGTTISLTGRGAQEVQQGLGEALGLYLLELMGRHDVLQERLTLYEQARSGTLLNSIARSARAQTAGRIALATYRALSAAELPVLSLRSVVQAHWKQFVSAATVLSELEARGLTGIRPRK